MNDKILIVDDDENICELLRLYLSKEGYQPVIVNDGMAAVDSVATVKPALILLDVMLPKLDGWQVCRKIRQNSDVPIIMLSAKGETFDKILGLELGADDYIVKPFEPKELIARIKAVMRRSQAAEEPAKEISFPGLTVNINRYQVIYGGREIEMPPKELEVLFFLGSHPNQVFTRQQLLEQVWDFDFFGDSRTVDVHVKRLREKLAGCEQYGWQIKTVWSVGYKFEVQS